MRQVSHFWFWDYAKEVQGLRWKLLAMTKEGANHGEYKLVWDPVNEMINGQWRDSRVVSFASLVTDASLTEIKRQIKSQRLPFLCPTVLAHYQNTMFGVDKGDQIRMHGGGFT